MSVKIKLKHSAVNGKAPLPSDLDNGELALNTNAASPAAYIKDSNGNIVKLAGAGAIGGTAATEAAAGIVELATAAETTTGTDATRAVHPAGLKVELDKKVDLAGDTMTGNLTVPSINGGPLAGFRNQLINGDFRIWQRGVSAYNNFGPQQKKYGSADRWSVGVQSAGSPGVLEQNPAAPQGFRYTGTFPAQVTANHDIENFGQFAQGSTWTLSLYAGGVAPVCRVYATGTATDLLPWGALGNKTAADGPWFRYSATFTIPSDIRNPTTFPTIAVLVQNASTNSMLITGVQLEPGPVATPFEHRPYGTELALCQRYYELGRAGGGCYWKSNGNFATGLIFKVEKRNTPTVIVKSVTQGKPTGSNWVAVLQDKYGALIARDGNVTGDTVYVDCLVSSDAEL